MRSHRRPVILAGLIAAALAAPLAARADTAQGQQELVDRATLAAQDVLSDAQGHDARAMLPQARAVMICPRLFKAGFLFGGEGGGCVLLARGGQGTWSAPAFYSVGGGSFGLQAGIQDAEVMMLILTQNGLRSVLDSQFRLGANASVAFVTLGGGVEGATTTNLHADIVAFARTRGLFAGVSLQGSIMSSDSVGDEVYYGQPVGPVDIVMAMRANNPAADPLRAVLMRYGSRAPVEPARLPPPVAENSYYRPEPGMPPQGYAATPPQGYSSAPPPSAVQQQSLPPPR
jgi:lipid-binding SYLF domain-containing protein